jgi:hypothetical protein
VKTAKATITLQFETLGRGSLPGSSLLVELGDVTHDQVAAALGSNLVGTPAGTKYSEAIVVRENVTGQSFTVYMLYGVYRIGGFSHEIAKALAKLIQEAE